MKAVLQKIRTKLGFFRLYVLPRFFTGSPFMSALYYLLFSGKFRREQHAVLKGKVKHLREAKVDRANIYTLIRNTHRLEKGLLMRPLRPVFAVDFIGETVDAFIHVWDPARAEKEPQYKWFFDVLQEYFCCSGSHPVVEEQARRFYSRVGDLGKRATPKRFIPYCRPEINGRMISFDDFYALARHRRSVRWFQDRKVPRDLVDKAVLAARQSPSACNRQPFEYRFIDDPELLGKVANLPGGVKGYVEGIPLMAVVVGNLDAYFDERDRHVVYIDASLANMSFMFALETLGLSSCAINWPDVEDLEREMEKLLKLEKHQRPLMCMAVGYPDGKGKVAYSEKRSLDYLRKYN